jgi:hypothetical protein
MTAENFDRVLNTFASQTPFHPFTVELLNGHRFEVDHPRAFVNRDGVAIFVAPGGIPVLFDHESVLRFIGDTAEASASA